MMSLKWKINDILPMMTNTQVRNGIIFMHFCILHQILQINSLEVKVCFKSTLGKLRSKFKEKIGLVGLCQLMQFSAH